MICLTRSKVNNLHFLYPGLVWRLFPDCFRVLREGVDGTFLKFPGMKYLSAVFFSSGEV